MIESMNSINAMDAPVVLEVLVAAQYSACLASVVVSSMRNAECYLHSQALCCMFIVLLQVRYLFMKRRSDCLQTGGMLLQDDSPLLFRKWR